MRLEDADEPSPGFLAENAGRPLPWFWTSGASVGAVWTTAPTMLGGYGLGGAYGEGTTWVRRRTSPLETGEAVVVMPLHFTRWPGDVRDAFARHSRAHP